ncbi:hypothetical protein K438DRAFT_1557227, partial [Mycena galopus ATCC 62051]
DRYDEFLRMSRQWRHLQMLKRAGRGHDERGVEGTQAGECAVLCPACPQLGKNLLPDWKDAPKEKRFLYALFLALDANFRMRRKKVSSEEKDPSLGDGWSFFGKVAPYYDYLAKHWNDKQPRSTCVAHDAVDKPDRESRGTASSGIATIDCASHNFKRPCSVGDLQLGERYINIDYIFFMGLAGSEIDELFVSYDIACQWHKNIWTWMLTFPTRIQEQMGRTYFVFLIPKFHLPAHIEACNLLFSFHLTRYVGMMDGEAPERGWAMLNPLASSTAEMGPGMRRDTINDAFKDMNHRKIMGFGKWLLRKLVECVPELIMACTDLEELEDSLCKMGGEVELEKWRAEVEAWEMDPKNANPFETRVKRKTVMEVRREMADEVRVEMDEEMDIDKSPAEEAGEAALDEMHATEMIGMGLKLEELQRNLGFDVAGTGNHPSVDQQVNLTECTNKLRRKILTWMDTQVLFIPHVAVLRAEEDIARMKIGATQTQPGIQVQHMALWLPSSIKDVVECDIELREYEFRLRYAQAHKALDELRDQLLLRMHLYKFKDRFSRGVKANTRLGTKIKVVEERIRRTADQYRVARRALMNLGRVLKKKEWEGTLLVGFAVHLNEYFLISSTALQIEWAKTRARFLRQSEQLDLLEEEGRCILAFLRWQAAWWIGRAGTLAYAPENAAYTEGNVAYVYRHAARLHKLATVFEEQWNGVEDRKSGG